MENQEFHNSLMTKQTLLNIVVDNNTITLTADPEAREKISNYILECMSKDDLLILRDNLSIVNAVCRGSKISGFYFSQIDNKNSVNAYYEAATAYYEKMTKKEAWE